MNNKKVCSIDHCVVFINGDNSYSTVRYNGPQKDDMLNYFKEKTNRLSITKAINRNQLGTSTYSI